jgi:organic radical activating enzyme|tara:strand:+ start:2525 stop:3598 length:1074 start_codon:yes stop_codon:yes gene_type:complete
VKCKYLENQICVRSDGQYRLCCVSLEKDNKENIKDMNPQEWHDSEFHTKTREQLDRNEWPDACTRCEQLEAKGLDSQRTRVKEDGTRYVRNQYGPGLSHFDIRFGNSCNLKCISCFQMSSSSLAQEAIEMSKAGVQPLHLPLLDDPNFNWASDETMKRFENLPIREVYLTGGEPMVVRHLPKFLEKLDSSVVIRFNTNGTIWNPIVSKMLKRFHSVIMSMSLDAVDKKINYIRYPSKWDEIEINTQRYAEFCTVDITPTISILNASYYNEIIEWANNNHFRLYNENLLLTPDWLHVKNAPDELKKNYKLPELSKWADEPADPKWIEHFKRQITRLDSWRKIYIKDYLPEVAKAYELN